MENNHEVVGPKNDHPSLEQNQNENVFPTGNLSDPNIGEREYTSVFYRYTRFRPPLAKPVGDVLARRAVEVLKSF